MTTDPVSDKRDGILKRPATDPLVIETVTENEFWQFRAALDVVDGSGHAIPTPANVRLYLLSGFEHTGSLPAPVAASRGMCQNVRNLMYHGPTMRAVLLTLDAWPIEESRRPKAIIRGSRTEPSSPSTARATASRNSGRGVPGQRERCRSARLRSRVQCAGWAAHAIAPRWVPPTRFSSPNPMATARTSPASDRWRSGAAWHPHRMESSRSRLTGAGSVWSERLVHSIRPNQSGAREDRRSTAVARGTVSRPRGVRRSR